jgi:hypothetical protein
LLYNCLVSFRIVVPALVAVAALLLAGTSSAADSVSLSISPAGGNQVVFQAQNTGDSVVQSFVLVLGGGFNAGSLVSSSRGTCSLSGSSVSCTGLLLAPGCPCNPGESVFITLSGTGDPAGSTITNIVGFPAPAGTNAGATTTVAAQTPANVHTTTPVSKTVTHAKKIPRCKKGRHSTKAKPCHK